MPRDYLVTIVTLCKDKYRLTENLLSGLNRWEKESIDEVIVVDNNSTEKETLDGLEWWQKKSGMPVYVNGFASNLGFTLGANEGLALVTKKRVAEKRIVFLISNDVTITGRFVEQAAEILFSKKSLVGAKLLSHNTGWNTFDGRVFPYLEGYFLAATVDGWMDLDFFDPAYAPYDFEDVDLSTNALQKGYQLVPLNNPAINHLGGGTLGYNPEREKITRRNQEYFRKKWIT